MRPDNDSRIYLMDNGDTTTVYLKNVVDDPDIEVGAHTYYNDPVNDPRDFVKNNVLYHVPDFYHDKIVIGKYCSIACGVKFICPVACHKTDVTSTYPFALSHNHWDLGMEYVTPEKIVNLKGPTIVGNDVWLGYESIIMPGVTIGDGAVVGTRSIVTKDVEPYTVVAGSPAKPIRKRFDDKTIERLEELKWWDLPDEIVAKFLPMLIEEKDINKVCDAIWVEKATYEVLKRYNAALNK